MIAGGTLISASMVPHQGWDKWIFKTNNQTHESLKKNYNLSLSNGRRAQNKNKIKILKFPIDFTLTLQKSSVNEIW